MNKIFIGLAIFAVVVGIAGYKAYSIFTELKSTVSGGPIEGPKSGGWDQLKEGISVKEAQSLLGDGLFLETTSGDVKTTYLSYTFTNGALAAPSSKGHNLLFKNDKLIKWTKPGEEMEAEPKIQISVTSETPESSEEKTDSEKTSTPVKTPESSEEKTETETKAE